MTRTYGVAIGGPKIISSRLTTAKAVGIANTTVVERLHHESLSVLIYETRVLLEGQNECCADKSTPIRVPRVISYSIILIRADIRLKRMLCVISVPLTSH